MRQEGVWLIPRCHHDSNGARLLLGFRSRRCSAFPLSWHSTIRASLDRFGFFWRSRREKQQRRSQPPDKRVSEHLFRRFFFCRRWRVLRWRSMSEDDKIITPLRTMIAVIVFVVGIAVGVLLAAWFSPL